MIKMLIISFVCALLCIIFGTAPTTLATVGFAFTVSLVVSLFIILGNYLFASKPFDKFDFIGTLVGALVGSLLGFI